MNVKGETFCWILLLLAVPIYSLAIIVLVGVVYLANYAEEDGTSTTLMGTALCVISLVIFVAYNALAFYITSEDYSNQVRYERIKRRNMKEAQTPHHLAKL
ncbi:uncharacterized protein LOC142344166 isoform X2 [Convolutriloba macropyga]|uniref:uncharacterized protein LOC142344166 isoform X2 n=1 Tax=Convolutriloba macropyga TaxID=536237 RepID=UPI003F521F9C